MSNNKKTVGNFKDLRNLIGTGEKSVPSELKETSIEFQSTGYTLENKEQAKSRMKRKKA